MKQSIDRRKFIGMFTGGLVAMATMAEAESLADFMKWLKKGPTEYSFPTKAQDWPKYQAMQLLLTYDDSAWEQVGHLWAMSYAK